MHTTPPRPLNDRAVEQIVMEPLGALFPGAQTAGEGVIFAGPCSAESEEQVEEIAASLSEIGVRYLRAGIWKPRSQPGGFEGVGPIGLRWLRDAGDRHQLYVGTEVGTPEHARLALDHGLDFVWVGARTTTSPFAIDELTRVLSGAEVAVLIKNPVAPDVELWVGAIRRFLEKGITRLAAIHRGFSVGAGALLRNLPLWSEVTRLRALLPGLPVLCDPSHIAGRADLVPIIAEEALARSFDGLFIEAHPDPMNALSDAAQQLLPTQLDELLKTNFNHSQSELDRLRLILDNLDEDIVRLLSERSRITTEIGAWKDRHDLPHHQPKRETELYQSRSKKAQMYGVSPQLIKELFETIHNHSIQLQNDQTTTIE